MSVEAITWAWKVPVSSQSERLVLLALADSANGDTRECWPSHRFIAKKAMCSVPTVKRALKALEAHGYITKEPRFSENERQSNLYTVLIDPPVHSDPPVHNSDLTPVHNSDLQNRKLTVHKWGSAPEGVDPQAWQDWAEYKRGNPAKATITRCANLLRKHPPEIQRQMVDESIRNSWKGLFEPRGGSHGNTSTNNRAKTFDDYQRELAERYRESIAGVETPG